MVNEARVRQLFSNLSLSDGEQTYLKGQAQRISYVVELVQKICDELGRPANLLDVGPHFLTRALIELLAPRPTVSTLGYPFEKLVPATSIKKNIVADFNDLSPEQVAGFNEKFDIIMVCEVIEHLFVPPNVLFNLLRPLLAPGGRIVVGTPNAVCWANRIKMLLGLNPFHALNSDYRSGAGHIREYTMSELREYGQRAGLFATAEFYENYWGEPTFPGANLMSEVERNIREYREGLTIVFCASPNTVP